MFVEGFGNLDFGRAIPIDIMLPSLHFCLTVPRYQCEGLSFSWVVS